MKQELLQVYITIPNQNQLHTTKKLWIFSCICVSKLTWQEEVKQKTKEVTKCYTRKCMSKYTVNCKYTICTPGQYYTIKL
jgi:hypothetical protein